MFVSNYNVPLLTALILEQVAGIRRKLEEEYNLHKVEILDMNNIESQKKTWEV